MAIKITEDGNVIYENEPTVERELLPNITDGEQYAKQAEEALERIEEIAESIPEDYTQLIQDVATLEDSVSDLEEDVEELQNNYTPLSEDVAELKNDFTQLETKVEDAYNAYVTETETGSIASFTDGADDVPVKDLSVAIEPVQDLHGQSAPYPAGGGKNQANLDATFPITHLGITITKNDDGSITINGTSTGSASIILMSQRSVANGAWTISGVPSGVPSGLSIWARNNSTGSEYARTYNGNNGTVTITTGTIYIYCTIDSGTTLNNVKIFLQLESGSTATTWSPYSNICPISGWTGANVTRAGGNLLNPVAKFAGFWAPSVGAHLGPVVNDYSSFSEDTIIVASPEWNGNGFASTPLVEGKQYKITGEINAVNPRCSFVVTDANMNVTRTLLNDVETGNINIQFTVASGEKYAVVSLINISGDTGVAFKNPSVSESGVYEPYQGETYEVDWTTEAGTVYGGTLDVTTGVLTVDRALWTKNTSAMNNDENFPGWRNSGIKDIVGSGINANFTNQTLNVGTKYSVNTQSGDILFLPMNGYNKTQAEWQALALDVQIVAELATPQTYQFTPQEVKTILGQNNIFADCGSVNVQYRADTKLYIDKVLSA